MARNFRVERAEVTVEVTGDRREPGWTVISSAITLRAWVPGVDEQTFRDAVNAARDGCPISRAIKGNVEINSDHGDASISNVTGNVRMSGGPGDLRLVAERPVTS